MAANQRANQQLDRVIDLLIVKMSQAQPAQVRIRLKATPGCACLFCRSLCEYTKTKILLHHMKRQIENAFGRQDLFRAHQNLLTGGLMERRDALERRAVFLRTSFTQAVRCS